MTPDIKAIKDIREAAEHSDLSGFASVLTNNHTVIALCDEVERLRIDATRYQWLRKQQWEADVIGVIVRPKTHAIVGSPLPSNALLDDTIDYLMTAEL